MTLRFGPTATYDYHRKPARKNRDEIHDRVRFSQTHLGPVKPTGIAKSFRPTCALDSSVDYEAAQKFGAAIRRPPALCDKTNIECDIYAIGLQCREEYVGGSPTVSCEIERAVSHVPTL